MHLICFGAIGFVIALVAASAVFSLAFDGDD